MHEAYALKIPLGSGDEVAAQRIRHQRQEAICREVIRRQEGAGFYEEAEASILDSLRRLWHAGDPLVGEG